MMGMCLSPGHCTSIVVDVFPDRSLYLPSIPTTWLEDRLVLSALPLVNSYTFRL
jgi:hypothetical protein